MPPASIRRTALTITFAESDFEMKPHTPRRSSSATRTGSSSAEMTATGSCGARSRIARTPKSEDFDDLGDDPGDTDADTDYGDDLTDDLDDE